MSNIDTTTASAILFLDIDDVLCLNRTYGGYDVIRAISDVHPSPEAVFREVFDESACAVLRGLHGAMNGNLQYVISSTWREAFDYEQMREVLRRGGLGFVASALHEQWRTPIRFEGSMRANDIAEWLDTFHRGEPFAIVDDTYSGPSLMSALTKPVHPFHGRVVLCQENVGLLPEHAETLLSALHRPVEVTPGSGQ